MIIKKLVQGFLGNNCYILSGDNKDAVVIDPCKNADKILSAVKDEGLELKYILLTHGHFDHVGAVKELQSPWVHVYLGKDDVDKIDGVRARAFKADSLLEGDEELNLAGLNIKVIATPGHTGGGMCFFVAANEERQAADDVRCEMGDGSHGATSLSPITYHLFTGDTLFKEGIGRTDLPSGDYDELMKSIKEKLFVLPEDTVVYPGHGDETTILNERAHFIVCTV
jgi:glyoxylase-like metal-dependent hydrolase (beta-lactamase superfamily II)